MAQTYLLFIKMSDNSERLAMEKYFNEMKTTCKFGYEVDDDGGDNRNYTIIYPEQLEGGGHVQSIDDCIRISEIGFELLELLKEAPNFEHAHLGYEVDNYFLYDDLKKRPQEYINFDGFIISNAIFNSSKKFSEFERFSHSHMWNPYKGEVYIRSYKENEVWKSEKVWSYGENQLNNNN